MKHITPFLWFNDNAEEAVNFYTSIFPHSAIGTTTRYGGDGAEVSGRPAGSVMTIAFELNGQVFTALNGGPMFHFTEAISFVVNCDSQEEIDLYWEKLSAGGEEQSCGWLKDKFGISWQIVPVMIGELLGGNDPDKTKRAMQELMKMKKIDINKLQQA